MSASSTKKILIALKSGDRCAFKDCRKLLTSDGVKSEAAIIGEAAHIYGEKPSSARYQPNMTDKQKDSENNLIYLCPTCHTKIDKQEQDYPADFLFNLKKEHEKWVEEKLDQGMSDFSFVELEIAVKSLASAKHYSNADDFKIISTAAKIDKNRLSDVVRSYISMGMSKSYEVERFIADMTTNIDEEFSERLKNGFKNKYFQLKKTLSGDELFMSMLKFAQAGQDDFLQQAASLAILSHLFHICEVFEK